MKSNTQITEIFTALCLALCVQPCLADDLSGLLNTLGERREAVKSLHHVYALSTGRHNELVRSTVETWEVQADDGRKRATTTQGVSDPNDPGPSSTVVSTSSKVVSDGRNEWRELSIGKTLLVVKSKPATADEFRRLRALLKLGKARKRDSETIAGEDCLVIECVGKEAEVSFKATFWISKKHGIILKQITERSNGHRRTMVTKSIEINKPVAPKRFLYTPPESARIVDLLDMKPTGLKPTK